MNQLLKRFFCIAVLTLLGMTYSLYADDMESAKTFGFTFLKIVLNGQT